MPGTDKTCYRQAGLPAGRAAILAIVLALSLLCSACAGGSPPARPVSGDDYLLNTYCTIVLYEAPGSREAQEDLIRQAFRYARDQEAIYSRTLAESPLARFNEAPAGQAFSVPCQLAAVVEAGLAYGRLSEGRFDITVGALSQLWDLSSPQPRVPEEEAIQAARATVDYRNVTVTRSQDGQTCNLTKALAGSRLDLGGIAKGTIADGTRDFLEEQGVEAALINFGGNVVTLGEKGEGLPWIIGLESPRLDEEEDSPRELAGEISVSGGSVVTSGIYERRFYQEGILYHHVLDPFTGYPAQTDLVSATVLGPSSMDCDALSTVCLLLGAREGLALLEGLAGYEGVFIDGAGRIYQTEGMVYKAYGQ